MNLSSNAIKYNHFHGTVNVYCEELSDDGNIAVFQFVCSDTGLGMTADEVDEYINQVAFSGATDFLEKYKKMILH